jgi:chromosome segregation ATPase
MNQEKFINAYVELLQSTLTEALQKNLVLQVQKKLIEDETSSSEQTIMKLKEDSRSLLSSKQNEIDSLKSQLNDCRTQAAIAGNEREEYKRNILNEREEYKKNIQHVDTFKNELIKSRQEVETLLIDKKNKDKEIEILKQRVIEKEKEIHELKNPVPKKTVKNKTPSLESNKEKESVKDAGSF